MRIKFGERRAYLSRLGITLVVAALTLSLTLDAPAQRLRDQAPPHNRPIIERDGQTLLWARAKKAGGHEYFDVTDSIINPRTFQYGIGKDKIPSIDRPVFAKIGDPRLKSHGITDATIVIGYKAEGETKAYPINILDRHELVNDRFGDKPIAVGW